MNTKVTEKYARLKQALKGSELPDRVPVSDFFWTNYVLQEKKLHGEQFDPFRFYDLDYVCLTPNMDPKIQPFEILEDNGVDIVLKTGFGATIKRSGRAPMPHYDAFAIDEPELMAQFTFDDPWDERRFNEAGDDQINGVGDAIARNIPAWTQRLDSYKDDFPIFGSVCEGYEFLWRCIGTENALIWQNEEPEMFEAFVKRIGQYLVEFTKAQVHFAKGRLQGMYIWGDVAYVRGMLFSPATWRKLFKPILKEIIDVCHEAGLLIIYHGCGNASLIYEDYIAIGLDCYNPLECKSGLDMVKLRDTVGYRMAFAGNIDVRELESGDKRRIKREVLYKLTGAVNGRWIMQSDHSVSSGVTPESYSYALQVIKEYGNYPLDMEKINAELAELSR